MKLTCYIFEASTAGYTFRLVERLCEQMKITAVSVVYRDALDGKALQDNAQQLGIQTVCKYLPYDGICWEFAAYQLGFDSLQPCEDGVIVVNDTAGRNYPFLDSDLLRFSEAARRAAVSSSPAIVGKLETNGCGYSLEGNVFDRWVRSNIFYLNAAALDSLNGTLFDPKVFNGARHNDGKLAIDLEVSEDLRRYLLQWLSPDAGKHGWLVHAKRGRASAALLRGKLGSILLEKHLSARLAAAGAQFLSYEPAGRSWSHQLAVWLFFKKRRLKRAFGV